ncbi:PKD domain-containing protein [Gemmatimonadota bacterium]
MRYFIILLLLVVASTNMSCDNPAELEIPPTANFNASPTSGTAPLTVAFSDESYAGSKPITSWSWNFGDGETSTTQNPSHTYNSDGLFSASLTVTTTVDSDTKTRENYIQVSIEEVPPTADFTATPTSGRDPLTVNFTDASQPGTSSITSWLWDFGDGSGGSSPNPSHVYNEGSYTVSLSVTTAVSTDSEVKPGHITVLPQFPPPTTPGPVDGASNVSTTIVLSWSNASSETLTYDVYFGTDSTPDADELLSEGQSGDTYTLTSAEHNNTTYYWKIVAWAGGDSASSEVWDFSTEATTTVRYYPTKDASIEEANPAGNWGDSAIITMGNYAGAWDNEYLYMQFDLASNDRDGNLPIPTGANIADGDYTIKFYVDYINVTGENIWPSNNGFDIEKIAGNWTETGVTWWNKPSSELVAGGLDWTGPFVPNQWVFFSTSAFTNLIRDWIATPVNNKGIVIKASTFNDANVAIRSREYTADTTTRPVLRITYTYY